jgi:hypothetical protein
MKHGNPLGVIFKKEIGVGERIMEGMNQNRV